jgi:23S rRNA (uracil1939-C5)-methyltransferase
VPHPSPEARAESVRIEKMAAGGDALAHLADGRVVFVEGALPGESVRVAVVTAKRDFARATTTEVIEPSPHRVAPPCPAVARGCGGAGGSTPPPRRNWR